MISPIFEQLIGEIIHNAKDEEKTYNLLLSLVEELKAEIAPQKV